MIITVLVMSFILATYSPIDNARGATPYPNPTPKPTATPTYPLNQTSKFGYSVVGKENSSMPTPKTITLCNYTTPSDSGTIVQISIYLTGIRGGSHVRAVIFANEPQALFPQGGEPIAQSLGYLNVTSVSGDWYNFTMNYKTSPNTVYWLGYYADDYTHYFYDTNNNSISITSQPKDGNSSWLPVGWSYQGKSIMSLYALCTLADPKPSTTPAHLDSVLTKPSQSFQDVVFVLLVIGAESALVVTHKIRNKKDTTDKHSSRSKVCM
jgi:hypothetical protein